jgi:hypothetical protein
MNKFFHLSSFLLLSFLLQFSSLAQRIQSFEQGKSHFVCGTDDSKLSTETTALMRSLKPELYKSSRIANSSKLECLVAVDIDYQAYVKFKNKSEAINYVHSLFNQVSLIFERDLNIKITVSYVNIWETSDNYSNYSADIKLRDFKNYWKENKQDVKRNIVHLISGKLPEENGVTGAGVVGLGTVGGICTSEGAYSLTLNGNNSVLSVMTIAHELGHNFGSPHTHNCNWAGGPIDFCSSIEGDCYKGNTEDRRGTIMSYCFISSMQFHPLCVALMRQNAEGCLKSFDVKSPIITQNLKVSDFSSNPYLSCDAVEKVRKYRFQIASDNKFQQIKIDSSVTFPLLQIYGLEKNTNYYWRISTINEIGNSDWSALQSFTTNNFEKLGIPSPIYPAFAEKGVVLQDKFSFTPVTDASAYQIQITRLYHPYCIPKEEGYKFLDTTISINQAKLNPGYENSIYWSTSRYGRDFFWRVRAIRGNEKGEWSSINQFDYFSNGNMYLYPNKVEGVPTTVILEYGGIGGLDIQETVEVATESDFRSSSITHRLSDKYNQAGYIGYDISGAYHTLSNLKPNTKYYYRIKLISDKSKCDWQMGAFSTGKDTKSKWTFQNKENGEITSAPTCTLYDDFTKKTWYGFYGEGVKSFDGSKWVTYTTSSTKGLFINRISSLASGLNGNLFMMALDAKIYKFDNIQWTEITPKFDPNGGSISEIVNDKKGNLYIAQYNKLFIYDGKNWSNKDIPLQTINNYYAPQLKVSSEGLITCQIKPAGIAILENDKWTIYTDKKLSYFNSNYIVGKNKQVFTSYNAGDGFISIDTVGAYKVFYKGLENTGYGVIDMKMDKDGTIWGVFYEKLEPNNYNSKLGLKIYKLNGDKWESAYNYFLPLSYNGFVGTQFYFMDFDKEGRMLFSLYKGEGLRVFDPKKIKQTIKFDPIADLEYTETPITLSGIASSGLMVNYVVKEGKASPFGDKVKLIGVGKVTIQANQDGDEDYDIAPAVSQSFNVSKIKTNLSFENLVNKTLGDTPFGLTTKSNSKEPVALSISSGKATLENNKITLTDAGKVTLKAIQNETEFYLGATTQQSFCVIPTKPTITIGVSNPREMTSSSTIGNQWFLNQTAISNANGQIYIAQTNGTYTVKIQNPDNSCPASELSQAKEILILENEDYSADGISISPNPAENTLKVLFPDNRIRKIVLYDMFGRSVLASEIVKSGTLNIESLTVGTYIINIISESDSGIQSFKIFKN